MLSFADGHGSEYMLLLDCLAVFEFYSRVKVVSAEFYFHKLITVDLELYLFYCFIHFLLYIGQY